LTKKGAKIVQETKIDKKMLEIWADYLLDHSLGGVVPGDRVMIKGERIGWPLMEVLERKVIEAGAVPDVNMVPPNNDRGRVWSSNMGRFGNEQQFVEAPSWCEDRYKSMTKYVEILGAEEPSNFVGLTPEQSGAVVSADAPYAKIRLAKNWVITLFPTPKMAEMEGLEFDDYVNFIVRASTTDPTPLREAEEQINPLIENAKTMTIVTEHPHDKRELTLEMNLELSHPTMSYGLRNFPDGEVFTSPDARSPQGEIFIDLPIRNGGTDIEGIYLKIEDGLIVDYSADQGGEQLASIIETDEGSKRLGEVALGMNPGLDRVLKHPLFVEKVGGTLHIAIGASYPDCYVEDSNSDEGKAAVQRLTTAGILNVSAQHVDIVADFRTGGCGRKVMFDQNQVVVKDGIWVLKD
jgi:aminopeptidase